MNTELLDKTDGLAELLEKNSAVDPRSVPLRFSTLKQFARSAQHYLHAVQSSYEETLSMRLGTATHALLFGQPLVVWSGKTRAGKAWDAFQLEHDGMPIVNAREHAEATAMVKAVRSNRLATDLLEGATFEKRIDWAYCGRSCRSTPDARRDGIVVDFKTSRTSHPEQFIRSGVSLSYHAQLAFYQEAITATGGIADEAFIIAVESKAPYPVTVLRVSERALEAGRRLCRAWFEQLSACEQSGEFPSYAQSIVEFDVDDAPDEFIFDDDNQAEQKAI